MSDSSAAAPRSAAQAPTGTAARQRRVTIQDVAREAGVSVSAVSKVVREAYGVSEQMRSRVTAAIETLGYRPRTAARAMRGQSYTIGVMLPEFSSPFPLEVSQGVAMELQHTPYRPVFVTSAGTDTARQLQAVDSLLDSQVDGVILIAPWLDIAWIESLGAQLPVVTAALHGPSRTFDTVVDDDRQGARLLVDHLVSLGHTRIVHTSQPEAADQQPFLLSHTARRAGYEEAMRRHGLEPDVIETQYSEAGGYRATIEALRRPDPPTAILAGADIAALGALRAADELGLGVPEDVSITGYDNVYWSSTGRIALTTVDQSGESTGATAARLLMERLEGRTQPVHYVMAPQLRVRHTTGPVPSGAARQRRKA